MRQRIIWEGARRSFEIWGWRAYLEVKESHTDVLEADMANSMCLFISNLPHSSRLRNQFLLLRQERSLLWTIRKHKERDDARNNTRQTLNQEEQPPIRNPMLIIPTRYPIRKGTSKARRQRCRRKEDTNANTNLMPQIKKAEQIGYSRPVASLEKAQEETCRHHAREGESSGLQSSDDAPAHNAESGPDVRRDDFPHEREPFEDDVGDIEDCQEPLVVGR